MSSQTAQFCSPWHSQPAGTHWAALDVLHIPLDGYHSLLVWAVDVVPHAQTAPILGHHHITARNPLHIAAIGQQGHALLAGNRVQVQVAAFVPEEQVGGACIELLQAEHRVAARLAASQPTGHRWQAWHLSGHMGADAAVAASTVAGTTDGWRQSAKRM